MLENKNKNQLNKIVKARTYTVLPSSHFESDSSFFKTQASINKCKEMVSQCTFLKPVCVYPKTCKCNQKP